MHIHYCNSCDLLVFLFYTFCLYQNYVLTKKFTYQDDPANDSVREQDRDLAGDLFLIKFVIVLVIHS